MIKFESVDTWADVLAALQKMSPEQLAQPAQVAITAHGSVATAGKPVYCIGTVDGLEIDYFRSCNDNRRHGEEVVLMYDWNPQNPEGVWAWEMSVDEDGEFGKATPLFPRNHDFSSDWTGPAQAIWDSKVEGLPPPTEETLASLKGSVKNPRRSDP